MVTRRRVKRQVQLLIGLAGMVILLVTALLSPSSLTTTNYSFSSSRHLLQAESLPTPTIADEGSSDGGLYPSDAFTDDQLRNGAIILYILGIFYMFYALALVCDDYFVPALEVLIIKLNLSDDVAGATFMAAGGSAPELFTSILGVFVAKSEVGFGTIVGSAVFNVLFVIGACAVATRDLAREQGGLPLTWWPLTRDSLFYGLDLILLMAFFLDKEIQIYESGIMLLAYASYVVFMKYNLPVYTYIRRRIDSRKVTPDKDNTPTAGETIAESRLEMTTSSRDSFTSGEIRCKQSTRRRLSACSDCHDPMRAQSGTGWMTAKTVLKASSAARIMSGTSREKVRRDKPHDSYEPCVLDADSEHSMDTKGDSARVAPAPIHITDAAEVHSTQSGKQGTNAADDDDDDDEVWRPVPPDDGLITWLLFFPLNFVLWLTLPDKALLEAERNQREREMRLIALSECIVAMGGVAKGVDGRYIMPSYDWLQGKCAKLDKACDGFRQEGDDRPAAEVMDDFIASFGKGGLAEAAGFLGWSPPVGAAPRPAYGEDLKLQHGRFFGMCYIGGFVGSILWIAGFSYLMVWWAERTGQVIGIPSIVMGITFLAAGTSVPDLITSVIVAKSGKGDMAVSSSIGSNIFDAAFGLPLPWFLWSLAHKGEAMTVTADSLGASILMLFFMLLSVIAAIHLLGWRLNIALGGLCLVLYCIFLVISLLIAFNVISSAF